MSSTDGLDWRWRLAHVPGPHELGVPQDSLAEALYLRVVFHPQRGVTFGKRCTVSGDRGRVGACKFRQGEEERVEMVWTGLCVFLRTFCVQLAPREIGGEFQICASK